MGDTGILSTPVDAGVEAPEVNGGMFDDVATETPEVETETPQVEEGQSQDTPPGKDDPAAEAAAAEPGKSPLPSQVSKMLRELSEAHPEHAASLKGLRGEFFQGQEFKSVFPGGTEEARALKATFEAVGGEEGIAELQSRVEGLRTIDEMVERGDRQVIDDMATESPDGFKKLVPAALERLERLDPRAYDDTLRGPMVRALQASGLRETLQQAHEYMKANQPEYAMRELQRINAWLKGHEDTVASQQAQRDDPRVAQIEARERELQAREQQDFSRNVAREIVPYANSKVEEALKPFIGKRNLSAETMADLRRAVVAEIDETMAQDKNFKPNWDSLLRSKNMDRITSYARSQIDRAASKAAKSVWTRRYGSAGPSPAAPRTGVNGSPASTRPGASTRQAAPMPGQPGTFANPLKLPSKPAGNTIDWSKDDDRGLYISHQAWLLNGKFVKW